MGGIAQGSANGGGALAGGVAALSQHTDGENPVVSPVDPNHKCAFGESVLGDRYFNAAVPFHPLCRALGRSEEFQHFSLVRSDGDALAGVVF